MKGIHHIIKILLFSVISFISLSLSSCSSDEPNTSEPAKRTILVYMIASNSLGVNGFDQKDLIEMEDAVKNNDMNDCKIVVYYVQSSQSPILFEFSKKNHTVSRITLKTYNSDIASTTISRMREVINDVQSLAPADDYGLILWSHALGWAITLPKSASSISQKSISNTIRPLYRTYGDDNGKKMALDELADAIPDNFFHFIYVDACYMGGIEEAYQLRNKTKYYIGSPTLLPADGMPYDDNIIEFVKDQPDLRQACINTYNYYNSLSGANRTISISLVDCSKLNSLAEICNIIYKSTNQINKSDLQGYIDPKDAYCIYYDFGQYMNLLATESQSNSFNELMNQVVPYKASTNYIFLSLKINQDKYSGLSVYLPNSSNSANNDYYKTLDWYIDTHK